MTPLARVWPGTSALYAALTPYLRAPRTLLATLVLSFLFQAIVITVVFLNARALGLTFPVAALAVFVPLISLGAMLPLSINGLGVRDALYLLLFGRLGTPPDVAISLALLYLAVTIVVEPARRIDLPSAEPLGPRRTPGVTHRGWRLVLVLAVVAACAAAGYRVYQLELQRADRALPPADH